MKFALNRNFFTDREETVFESGDLKASIYKFKSGVEVVKLQNALGYLTVLPFKGHTIWEAAFNGRILNMHREGKKEPKFIHDYFLDSSYGVFLFHCGALRMGCPAEDDDHIMHGELPCAVYDDAELIVGSDERGDFVGITGTFTYNRGFGPCYAAKPIAKIYSQSSIFEITMRIENISNYPMELMYMAHINYRPIDNSRIVQSHPWDSASMPLRDYVPSHFEIPADYRELTQKLKENPKLTEVMIPNTVYKPEVAFYLDNPVVDSEGWIHIMQVLPDGTADFLKYKPSELDHAMRWITRTADQQGLALAFPSTCNVEGYNNEKKQGHVKEIAPKGFYQATMITGVLNKDEVAKEEAIIQELMS